MKKIILIFSFLSLSIISFSQKSESDPSAITGQTDKERVKQQIALSTRNINDDKIEIIEVSGYNSSSFSTMNYPDASSRSSSQLVSRINVKLVTNKTESYHFVFFPDNERVGYSIDRQNGVTSIFYPLSMYQYIIGKMDQVITSKKKLQLKLISNPNGYKEAILN